MDSLWQDLRFAFRLLIKSPGFAVVAIATLALGIGVNAIVFTVADEVLFKQFPFDHADRILYMISTNSNAPQGSQDDNVSYPDYRDWKSQAKTLGDMAALAPFQASVSDKNSLPEIYRAARVTSNSFRLIGQTPAIGRGFVTADDQAGAPPVVLLGNGLWERRYGSNPAEVGRSIRIDGVPTTVIGVMPRDFDFPFTDELWTPLAPTADSEKRDVRNLIVIGRMADGVTLQAVRTEMNAISQRLQHEYPNTNKAFSASVQTYTQFFVGPELQAIFEAMLGAVAFVLLIACANVANLLLGRGMARSREMSIRIALGAAKSRIIRQLLVESVLLSVAGAVFGWLIAVAGLRACVAATAPYTRVRWMNFSMDYRMFIYFAVISVGTGIFFGLAPAFRAANVDIHSALKEGGRGSSVGLRDKALSKVLVVIEIALALILLVGAGLTIRTFLQVYKAQLGVGTSNILTLRLPLSESKYPLPSDKIAFYTRLLPRLRALPGVQSVAIANFLPTGGSNRFPYELEESPPVNLRPSVSALIVSEDYFSAIDAPILSGRSFTGIDGVSGPPVVIVNERFARQTWNNENPLGRRLRLVESNKAEGYLQVVGVVPNIVQNDISPRQVDPIIYLPFREKPLADMAILARTFVPPGTLAIAFRREVQQADPDLSVYNLWTLRERLARNYWFFGFVGSLFAGFAGVALLLASVGLYAVIAHSVGRRTQEIGVRMAMGATPRNILWLVFEQSMRHMLVGIAIGLLGAFLLTRILRSFLVQVSPVDPITFCAAALLLILAAALGCLAPARRATKVDPIDALRSE